MFYDTNCTYMPATLQAVVIDEVDNFLFRPHLVLRAKYHAVCDNTLLWMMIFLIFFVVCDKNFKVLYSFTHQSAPDKIFLHTG